MKRNIAFFELMLGPFDIKHYVNNLCHLKIIFLYFVVLFLSLIFVNHKLLRACLACGFVKKATDRLKNSTHFVTITLKHDIVAMSIHS